MSSDSWALKKRRQEARREEYLRETGRGVTLAPRIAADGAKARGAAAVPELERLRRWELAARAIRLAASAKIA